MSVLRSLGLGLLSLLTLSGAWAVAPVPAAAAPRAILVLDASGSMWGRVGDREKIVVARDVVRDLLADWDEGVELGLAAYGHRRKGDCADIEMLIPAGPVDRQRFQGTVDGLQPKGKTPLTDAVRQAARALRFEEEPATVILVTDGEETCDADPCAVAAELEALGVDFTTHVIGFDLSSEQEAQVSCIAEKTGGKFLPARDAASLNRAFSETIRIVAQAPPKPAPAADPGLKLQAVLAPGGEVVNEALRWWIYEPEVDVHGKRKQVDFSSANQPFFKLAPGKYHVYVDHGKAVQAFDLELPPGEALVHTVVLDAGYARIKAVPTPGADPLNEAMRYWIYHPERDIHGKRKQVDFSSANQPLFRLNSGKYVVWADHGKAVNETEFTITAGQLTDLTLDMNAGYLRLSGVPTEGADPLKEAMRYWVKSSSKDLHGKRKDVDFSSANVPLFRLTDGTYWVYADHGKATWEGEVTVKAGQLTEKTLDMNAGYLRLSAIPTKGQDPIGEAMRYWVNSSSKDLHGKRKDVDFSSAVKPLFRLNAGTYWLYADHGKAVWEGEVTVRPGQLTDETLDMNAGYLRIQATAGGKPLASGVRTWIKSAEKDMNGNRQDVDFSSAGKPLFRLQAGRYHVYADRGKQVFETDVTVGPGQIVDLELEF